MSLKSYFTTLAALLLALAASASHSAVCEAVNLRVESQVNPLGVDTPRPRLSWQMADSRRGARQTAYRILVASKPELLREGKADLWDSLFANSDRCIDVGYGGKRIGSGGRAWWTVRVWDTDGSPSPWSRAARWEVPLLSLSDWTAQWIGVKSQADEKPDTMEGVQWIWAADAKPGQDYAAGKRWFRASFDLPNKPIKSAVLVGAVDEQFTAYVNGQNVGSGSGWVTAATYPVGTLLKPGRNVTAVEGNNTGGPAGLAILVRVTFEDGTTQRFTSGPDWKSSMTQPARWSDPGADESGWQSAAILGNVGPGIWGMPKVTSGQQGGPASLLRKTFTLAKPVKSARVYVTARGSYRLQLNGKRVGQDILTPDWTDYRKRIPYQIYDVTGMLRQGENAIGAMLGDGWYASGLGWALQRWSFGLGPTQLLMQMRVDYTDGTSDTIVTDGTWKTAVSAILRSEIYAGETYDGRKEQPGWDLPRFSDSGWKLVDFTPPVGAANGGVAVGKSPSVVALVAQASPTIQVTGVVKPIAITTPLPGVYIYDMGQNMVGWARLSVRGKPGDKIRMRFAEILQPNGQIYTENLRRAEATDTYICRGRGDSHYMGKEFNKDSTPEDMHKPSAGESWEPTFTYHGFRYVEVTGYPGTPAMNAIEGRVFHTNAPATATFACSSDMVNKLWQNINWGLRGNLESVPTDCPQRDERLGWMGDAQIIWPTATYLRDVQSFTHKWMHDVVDAQSAEGGFSDVSPRVIDESDGAPAWGDAGIVLPYTAWQRYGDTRIIDENYPAMQKWVEYIHSANPNLLWLKRRNNDFGDWVAVNDTPTNKDVIATAYFAQDARMLAEMARATNHGADADKYDEMFHGIRAAFQKAFVNADGTIGNGSQSCYVLALHMGLLDPPQQQEAMRLLVADIARHNMHHTTGFIGTPNLMLALSNHGRDDVAYTLLLNDTFPSWGYMIKKGATSMWERWNGDTGDPAMNSFNHYAYGAVGEWMHRFLGGIDRAQGLAGFQRIVIRPRIDSRMTWANTSFDSPYGKVVSSWAAKPGEPFMLTATIPANTTAWVYVPAPDQNRVTEGGQPIDPASGIRFIKMENGSAVYEVPSGTYKFATR